MTQIPNTAITSTFQNNSTVNRLKICTFLKSMPSMLLPFGQVSRI